MKVEIVDKKIFCRLCLNMVCEENFTVVDETIREVLGIILLKLRVEQNVKPVICHNCATKLFVSFKFKAICMDTEDYIFPYINSENAAPGDLKEIYLQKCNKEHLRTPMEAEGICRLCMDITIEFTSVNDVEIDMLQKYIPEVNFNSTKNPVICTVCLDSLKIHSNFIKNCVGAEEQIKSFYECKENPFCIKMEEIDIKNEEDSKTDIPLLSDEGIAGISEEKNALKSHPTRPTRKVPVYRCYSCNFKSRRRATFVSHQLKHKKLSDTRRFECHKCEFKTKYRGNFIMHCKIHKDVSEVPLYSCKVCSYTTRHKNDVKLHEVIHKDISETPMYSCNFCHFKSKYQVSLNAHQRLHKDRSELQTFKCNMCPYETIRKPHLERHKLTHKDISERPTFSCDECGYKLTTKSHLLRHQLTHKNASEVTLYGCDICSFQTKHKGGLTNHRLTHMDISEVEKFKCHLCGLETKYKHVLKQHMAGVHGKKSSEPGKRKYTKKTS